MIEGLLGSCALRARVVLPPPTPTPPPTPGPIPEKAVRMSTAYKTLAAEHEATLKELSTVQAEGAFFFGGGWG